MKDHVHICLSIPAKFSVSNVVGYLKGKSAIYFPSRGIFVVVSETLMVRTSGLEDILYPLLA